MVEEVSTDGGYVWTYLPDRSRRWGELEARGHADLDPAAGHARRWATCSWTPITRPRDEYYYRAAEAVAGALIRAQHPSGGWNYLADFAGERSLREWYDTIGRNAWRMEEFQHHWGNATFDDSGTAESAKFLLRLYVEKRDAGYKPALDKAHRLRPRQPVSDRRLAAALPAAERVQRTTASPDYTSYLTFNDDVAGENVEFLVHVPSGARRSARCCDAIARGMSAFLVTQQGPPQPGWALQYTPDLQPAAARTYEPQGAGDAHHRAPTSSC